MIKKRYFSAHHDFRTGKLCKFFLLLGIIFLIIYLVLRIISLIAGSASTGIFKQIYDFSQTSSIDSILAFSLIFFTLGILFYFFYCQFAKLSKIAEEIENDESLKDKKD